MVNEEFRNNRTSEIIFGIMHFTNAGLKTGWI